jgi:Ni/Fe-hydrogenase 1 B-type cytochrome subunit
MATTFNFKRVYIWQLPVRVFHWVTVASMMVLIITGFIIADPPAINQNVEATHSFWFGYIRMAHFIAAFLAIAVAIVRLYWFFAGNKFANWRSFVPYTKKGWKNIWYVLKVDVLLLPDREHKLANVSVGHNHLAASSYLVMAFLFILQAATGLALMSETSDFWFTDMFAWVLPFFGGDIKVRYIHHILTWVFMAFIVIHVYLVLYHDYIEARGEASAMVSGYKFVRSERVVDDEEYEPAASK